MRMCTSDRELASIYITGSYRASVCGRGDALGACGGAAKLQHPSITSVADA